MSNFILYITNFILILISKFNLINSVIKFSIEINNEIFTLNHDEINNTTETFELIKKNFYICEDKKDCISCSFLIYEYAQCYWDCDHNRCSTTYHSDPFSAIIDLKEIYSQCSSCDVLSNENMDKNCDSRILVDENSDNKENNNNENNNNNNETTNIIEYSKINFMGLLCKYSIFNKYSKSQSIFHLNITKFYRYINIYLELDYGLYSRHINLKTQKNYDIDTVGVNSVVIYVYTPHNYNTKPFSIEYSFKLLKNDKVLNAIIILISIVIFIFSVLLILIFIEIYKGHIIKHGRQEITLDVNTLIFNRIKYIPNLFKNYNKKCFFCGKIIIEGKFVAQMKCRKHVYHYGCLMKWVRENMLDKTNFFCPMCQNMELHEISRSMVSRDDNDDLLNNNSNNNFINNKENEIDLKDKINKELLSNKLEQEKFSNITPIRKENDSNNINNEIIDKSISFEEKPESNNDEIFMSQNRNNDNKNNINNENEDDNNIDNIK